jgi:hypothetical protein
MDARHKAGPDEDVLRRAATGFTCREIVWTQSRVSG